MRVLPTILICAALLGLAGGAIAVIFSTEPTAQREGATRRSAMLVETVPVERGDHRPTLVALGSVEPAREVQLAPRVGGEVIERSVAFDPGAIVAADEVLLRIDPADYAIAVAERESELKRAEADLALERGRGEVAARDRELLGDDLLPRNEALVLRQPQLDTAEAAVAAARARLDRAQLELERTTIVAPFDGQILDRRVDLGSQVAAGEAVGRLVALSTYWVVATVPLDQLRWIELPDGEDAVGSPVRIRQRGAWGPEVFRRGRVARTIGSLDANTRLVRLIVEVDDPLARSDADGPPLMLGTFVEVSIEGAPLTDVMRIDREHLRRGDKVWLYDAGELRVRPVEVAYRDDRFAYVASGLEPGELLVTTNLSTVVDGSPLSRVEDGAPAGPGEGDR